ncbi:MAG: sulfur oxidation c-type cytochrome SoxA [Gammaproteobacteria bacterium]|nr:sulfur oxidation c-type cytochrome SoxA [Gammaproteobacteria bacterium]MCP5135599.1 sulfur oxidation c-type cytochrome SoxA [Gammaproteobacteria bacterium]
MKTMRILTAAAVVGALLSAPVMAGNVDPAADLKAVRDYFAKKFPETPFNDYINGVYSIDPASRAQWEAIEEFPPYEPNIDKGDELFHTAFANGKSLADCFPGYENGVRQNYPFFDKATKQVITLELAINQCREANGEKPLGYKKGAIADISAYLAFKSRGKKFDVKVEGADALAWYKRGRDHFLAKRGQLNLACADCHVYNAGNYVRADLLSPALGHVTHFPVYRSKWGELGTLHRRYGGCNKQVRAKPFKAQSEEYRALEFFHTYLSNGLEVNGPGARK